MSPEEWLKQQAAQPASTAASSAASAPISPEAWLSQQQAQPAQEAPQRSMTQELGRQLGLTLRAGAEGTAGFLGIFSDPIAVLLNQALPDDIKAQRLQPAISNMLTQMGVPLPENEKERIVQQAAQSLVGAGAGVATASRAAAKQVAGAAPTVQQIVAQQMAAQPAAQLAGGAAAGGAAQAVQESGGSPLAATGASLLAGAAGARMATPGVRVPPSQAARDIVQTGERFGVPVLTSDVRPPSTLPGRTAQQFGERTILGTAGTRATQQQKRIEAVQKVFDEFGADVSALKDAALQPVAQSFIAKRGADLSKYANMKKSVFEPLDTLGNMPVPNTITAIDQEIGRLSSITGSQPLIGRLEELKVTLQNNPNISAVEANRKVLGDWMNDAGLAAVKTEADKTARTLYGPLKEDMGNFIEVNGAARDLTKWKIANQRLAEMTGELNNNALSKALKEGKAAPEAIAPLLFSQKPSDLKLLYKNLPPSGRVNAQRAILAHAADKSRFAAQDGAEQFSPDRFNKYLQDNRAQLEVFFQGDARKTLDGLSRLLTATKRAGEANVSTASGMQGVPFLMGSFLTDMLGGAGAATTTAVGIGGGARLYESAPVRNLLMQLGTKRPGSQEEQQIIKRLLATVQTDQASQAVSNTMQEQP